MTFPVKVLEQFNFMSRIQKIIIKGIITTEGCYEILCIDSSTKPLVTIIKIREYFNIFNRGARSYRTHGQTVDFITRLAPRGAPDNLINAGDMVILHRIVLGSIQPNSLESVLTDTDGDDRINTADIILLQRRLLDSQP